MSLKRLLKEAIERINKDLYGHSSLSGFKDYNRIDEFEERIKKLETIMALLLKDNGLEYKKIDKEVLRKIK